MSTRFSISAIFMIILGFFLQPVHAQFELDVETGADNDEVYNFALINYAVVGAMVSF